jgi:Zn-dependent membrane protease YugP
MRGFYGIDWSYIVLVLPAVILAFYAQSKVGSTFNKYSRSSNKNGYTGAQVAQMLLSIAGINDVMIEQVAGNLTDHYDPRTKVLRLSQSVYGSHSIAALGVAAHETGHAIQHNRGYVFLGLRNAIYPVVSFSSRVSTPLIMLGFILSMFSGSLGRMMLVFGIILFAAVVAFQVITLPVEFNASARAIDMLEENNILYKDEIKPAKKVLSAAALTYVASAAVSMATLLRYVLLLSGSRRDD